MALKNDFVIKVMGFRDNRIGLSKQYGDVAGDAQTTSYGYNTVSMLTGESAPAKSAELPALSQSYSFDAMGNRTQWKDNIAKTLTNAVYNRLNQLTGTSNYNNFRNSLNEHFSLFSRFSSPALMRRLRLVGRRRSA